MFKHSDKYIEFGYRIGWYAIRSESKEQVADSIKLRPAKEQIWTQGMESAYRGKIMVTPPISGWVLVIGGIMMPSESVRYNQLFQKVSDISNSFHEAQVFYNERNPGIHVFAKAIQGSLRNAYVYWIDENNDDLIINRNISNDLVSIIAAKSLHKHRGETELPQLLDENSVLHVAGVWSISPLNINYNECISMQVLVGRKCNLMAWDP